MLEKTLGSPGIINENNDKYSIFSMHKQSWFDYACVNHLKVSNNTIFLITQTNKLIRIPLESEEKPSEILIPTSSNENVYSLHVDSRGNHIIISLTSGKNLYTTKAMKKFRTLNKMKGVLIEHIAWNRYNNNEKLTHAILVSTNIGIIYETNLDNSHTTNPECYWLKCLELMENEKVVGIDIIRYPPSSNQVVSGEDQKCTIIIATRKRLHQYTSWVNFENVQRIAKSPSVRLSTSSSLEMGIFYPIFQNPHYKCTEMPRESVHGSFDVFYPQEKNEPPKSISWLCEVGAFFANIDPQFLNQNSSLDDSSAVSLLSGLKLIQLSVLLSKQSKKSQGTLEGSKNFPRDQIPIANLITEAHIVVVFKNRIKAFNVLNQTPIFNEKTTEVLNEQIENVIKDPHTNRIWVYSKSSLAELKIVDESQRIWRVYLEVGDFDKARINCKNKEDLEMLNIYEAEYWFSRGLYFKSARLFARTNVAFEKIALQLSTLHLTRKNKMEISELKSLPVEELDDSLFEVDDINDQVNEDLCADDEVAYNTKNDVIEQDFISVGPLKVYLKEKLDHLIKSENLEVDSPAYSLASITVIWSIELWLHELGVLIANRMCQDESVDEHFTERSRSKTVLNNDKIGELRVEIRNILNHTKLRNVIKSNKETLYELFNSHGDSKEFVYLCKVLQDYDILIDHYMMKNQYDKAMIILGTSNHPGVIDRHYMYSAILAKSFSNQLVRAWIQFEHRLDPKRLFNAVINLPDKEMLKYLEFLMITKHRKLDPEFHQLLILKYVDNGEEDKLINYLDYQVSLDDDKDDESLQADVSFDDIIGRLKDSEESTDIISNLANSLADANKSEQRLTIMTEFGLALNLCKSRNLLKVVLYILQKIGMSEQALDLALERKDYATAREIINKPLATSTANIESSRKLWLKLAQHEIAHSDEPTKTALALIKECEFISLEDILPCFKQYTTVDELKDVICQCLDGYNQRIETLRDSMHTITVNCQEIKDNNIKIKSKPFTFSQNVKCIICFGHLISRTFYVYPCSHRVHSDCMVQYMLSLEVDSRVGPLAQGQELTEDTDEFLASNCPICGTLAVRNSTIPYFSSAEDYTLKQSLWSF